jgi:hypothetical protein
MITQFYAIYRVIIVFFLEIFPVSFFNYILQDGNIFKGISGQNENILFWLFEFQI